MSHTLSDGVQLKECKMYTFMQHDCFHMKKKSSKREKGKELGRNKIKQTRMKEKIRRPKKGEVKINQQKMITKSAICN